MIRIRLSTIMGSKRIKMKRLSEDTGIAVSTVFHMYHEHTQSVSFEVLDKLCKYFNCQVSDLLEYVPDEGEE